MSKLNKDILFLIFEELQDDSKSLFSCLMVNRLWCETVIPVLWRNHWNYNISYYNNKFLLQQEFHNLFLKKCPEVKYLDMKSIKHQIFYFSEAKARLESLCELKCDTSTDSSYFCGLSYICQCIQRLIIVNVNPKD